MVVSVSSALSIVTNSLEPPTRVVLCIPPWTCAAHPLIKNAPTTSERIEEDPTRNELPTRGMLGAKVSLGSRHRTPNPSGLPRRRHSSSAESARTRESSLQGPRRDVLPGWLRAEACSAMLRGMMKLGVTSLSWILVLASCGGGQSSGGVEDQPGADAPGTHNVQPLAGEVSCWHGLAKMGDVGVYLLFRRAIDGSSMIEDQVNFSKGVPPSRLVTSYTLGDGSYEVAKSIYALPGAEITQGTGTFESEWANWTSEIKMKAGTEIKSKGVIREDVMETESDIFINGKKGATVIARLNKVDADECRVRFSRVAPVEGL